MNDGSNKHNSFIMYDDWANTFDLLTDEERGKLIQAFFDYRLERPLRLQERALQILFEGYKAQLERDATKWYDIRNKRSKSGSEGGAPKGNKNAAKNKGEILSNVIGAGEDQVLLTIQECKELAIQDEQFMQANIATEDHLNNFNKHLIKQGEDSRTLKEYKRYFSNWLKKEKEKPNSKSLKMLPNRDVNKPLKQFSHTGEPEVEKKERKYNYGFDPKTDVW